MKQSICTVNGWHISFKGSVVLAIEEPTSTPRSKQVLKDVTNTYEGESIEMWSKKCANVSQEHQLMWVQIFLSSSKNAQSGGSDQINGDYGEGFK